ncbi:MAG TPA: flagellar hook protein FlgE [Stellaceae bacterium]
MSLQTELSGLQAAQSNINTIGNNVANVNTVGFKGFTTQLADQFSSSLSDAMGGPVPGDGVAVSGLAQLFTEGQLQQTGNPLDVAVNGSGFFQVQTDTGTAYTRDGSFQINNQGFLTTADDSKVQGFAASGTSGQLGSIQINTGSVPADATSQLTFNVNLPSTDPAIDTTTTPFSISNAASYNESTTTTAYDSMGEGLTLTTYFSRASGSGTPNKWDTHFQVTDPTGKFVTSGAGPTLSFNSSGQLTSGGGGIGPISGMADGATPLNITMDFTGSTLSNSGFGVASVTNNGNAGGQFSGVAINADGQVVGQYTNGNTKNFGTIALANFSNLQGLTPLSQNNWQATTESGPAAISTPTAAGLGALQSGSLEGANVDLSSQLVNLIVAQQAYQANVQGINIDQQDVQRLLTIQ